MIGIAVEAVKNGLIDFAVVSSPVYVDTSLKMVLLHSFQEILVGGTTFTAALRNNMQAVFN